MSEQLTLAAAGDAMAFRRVRRRDDRPFLDLVERIRDTDAALLNLEATVHDFEGYPAADAGMYMCTPPPALDDLAWMGFSLFSVANNHVGDFSHSGMEATMRELDTRNLTYAGIGADYADARRPAYRETNAGRIAIVAACSTHDGWTVAGPSGTDLPGRPGIAPLDVEGRYVVPEEAIEMIRDLSDALGLERIKRLNADSGFPDPDTDSVFHFYDRGNENAVRFEIGDEYRYETHADPEQATEIRDRISEATRQADWVFASLHAHQGATGHFGDRSVPKFVELFARECIDAGADAVFGHGPHVLRGIELYENCPIFYSLGDFVLHEESVTRLPAEMYHTYGFGPDATPADVFDQREAQLLATEEFWESVLPVCTFGGDGLETLSLYPVDLEPTNPRPRRGTPVLASGDRAERILDRVADLSAEYGTDVDVEDGIGIVRT